MISYLNEIIRNRRSVYPVQYIDKVVTDEFIQTMLENANYAPTHRLTQPWRFKVVRSQAKDRLGIFLAEVYANITPKETFSLAKQEKIKEKCKSASAIIVICMQRDQKSRVPEWEEIAATAMAVQNMWLTCAAHNVGSYWSSPELINHVGDFFDFKEGERCLGFFYLGHYDTQETISARRDPIASKVTWIK